MKEDRSHDVRELVLARVKELDPELSHDVIAEVFEKASFSLRALSVVALSLEKGPQALLFGAPPVVGRLVRGLRACGSVIPEPACTVCHRAGLDLVATEAGGQCNRCRSRQLATPCARCKVVKPVYGRGPDGEPLCSVCAPHPKRACSRCGRVKVIARRATSEHGEICESCYKGPLATCGVCGRLRQCNFVSERRPTCMSCTPRRTRRCAHCGKDRPVCARWPEGPVCEPCYRSSLMRRGQCSGCDEGRRLVFPPGPGATHCADCAGVKGLATCKTCGAEERPHSKGRCVRCALELRARELLGEKGGPFGVLYQAIVTAPNPYSVHNWLRSSGPSHILKEIVAGTFELSHEALDAYPRRRSADHLRHLLVAASLLAPRDDALVSLEAWVARRLEDVKDVQRRRLLRSYATWRVLRRARQRAERAGRVRTPTRHAKYCLNAAIAFLDFCDRRQRELADCTQQDVEDWLVDGPPSAAEVGDFLDWTATSKITRRFILPSQPHRQGPGIDDETRWTQARLVLHGEDLDLTDRVAGCLVLLYGQQLTRIAALRREQVTVTSEGATLLHLGATKIELPSPLDELFRRLADERRRNSAFSGAALASPWMFEGVQHGRPITAAQLGNRLRLLGIEAQAARRGALLHLGASLPAAVLARLLDLHPNTAVKWVRAAGGDWNTYAATLLRSGLS